MRPEGKDDGSGKGGGHSARRRVWSVLWQAALLAVISAGLGVGVNALRPDGLCLRAAWSPGSRLAAETGEVRGIPFSEAVELFLRGEAVFVDARPVENYEKGHIRGALSLPWEAVDTLLDDVMAGVSKDARIITYCDGETCALSKELALELYFRGWDHVLVLVNGWTRWRESQLPTDTGAPMTLGTPSVVWDFRRAA